MSQDNSERKVRMWKIEGLIGWMTEVEVPTYKEYNGRKQPVGMKSLGSYAFADLHHDRIADYVKGDLEELEDNAVIYIGGNFGKNFFRSHSTDDIPDIVLDTLEEKGLVLYENVDGGWQNWDGRPEWSDTYIDVSEATKVE